jgi:hypothetical protein
MKIVNDPDVESVLEFMQRNIPSSKIIGVANALPRMAELLWGRFTQEPVSAMYFVSAKPRPSQSSATESVNNPGVGDDSVVATGVQSAFSPPPAGCPPPYP